MKKLLNKLRKKEDLLPPSRITSETVAEHREQILAGGRKFKYPIQYAKHKLVFNALIISMAALILAIAIGWWQLYPAQNTSEFMYRVTKTIPVPVAAVDGQPVLYSDYLMKYLSSVHYLEQIEQVNTSTKDGQRQLDYIKQQSMKDAIADAYAQKLANQMHISISNKEIDAFLKDQRQTSDGEISEQTYDAVILDYYGWSPAEYRQVTQNKLLRQKVAYAMDKNALSSINKVEKSLIKDPKADLKTLASTLSTVSSKVEYEQSGWVPKFNQDGGVSTEAAKLAKGQLSKVIRSTTGAGYYIVRLTDINDAKVSYEYVRVPLTAFDKALKAVQDNHKVAEYISVPSR